MKLIYDFNMSTEKLEEFKFIQDKSWSVATKLNPKASMYGFNINSSYQCEIYPEYDNSPSDEWQPGDLTWNNFIELFPEYIDFCRKYNFYQGCTMIGRPIYFPHRHGTGEYTVTYPYQNCDGVVVHMITPKDIEYLNKNNIHCLKNNEAFDIDYEYTCATNKPFLLKANHFHTSTLGYIPKKTIFSVWHEVDTFTENDVFNLIERLNK